MAGYMHSEDRPHPESASIAEVEDALGWRMAGGIVAGGLRPLVLQRGVSSVSLTSRTIKAASSIR
jgi:hypothetical protein